MFTLDGIRKFHGWTHASLGLVFDHLASIPADGYTTRLPGFGFRTLREQAIHICNCEGFWIHILQCLPYADRTIEQCPAAADMRLLHKQLGEGTVDFLADLTQEQLNADRELRFPDGDVAMRTPALVMHHVLTHAFHHKGQIVAMCRALGYPAPESDLNQFL